MSLAAARNVSRARLATSATVTTRRCAHKATALTTEPATFARREPSVTATIVMLALVATAAKRARHRAVSARRAPTSLLMRSARHARPATTAMARASTRALKAQPPVLASPRARNVQRVTFRAQWPLHAPRALLAQSRSALTAPRARRAMNATARIRLPALRATTQPVVRRRARRAVQTTSIVVVPPLRARRAARDFSRMAAKSGRVRIATDALSTLTNRRAPSHGSAGTSRAASTRTAPATATTTAIARAAARAKKT